VRLYFGKNLLFHKVKDYNSAINHSCRFIPGQRLMVCIAAFVTDMFVYPYLKKGNLSNHFLIFMNFSIKSNGGIIRYMDVHAKGFAE
jgi:hypothetical protein